MLHKSVTHLDGLPDSAHLPITALAAIFGCSRVTIFRKFKNGTLPQPVRVLGHRGLSAGVVRAILAGEK